VLRPVLATSQQFDYDVPIDEQILNDRKNIPFNS
jgi:hypothetical protein